MCVVVGGGGRGGSELEDRGRRTGDLFNLCTMSNKKSCVIKLKRAINLQSMQVLISSSCRSYTSIICCFHASSNTGVGIISRPV